MKPLIIGLLLLGLIVFLLNTILKKPNAAELETNTQYGTDQGQQATPTRSEDTVPHFLRKPQSVEEQMAEILTDAHVTSDKYLQLVRLLETDESAVLAFLATRPWLNFTPTNHWEIIWKKSKSCVRLDLSLAMS